MNKCLTCSKECERTYCSYPCYWISKKGKPSPRIGQAGLKRELNPAWKGSNATYGAIHMWIYKNYGKAFCCEDDNTHKSKRFEWANLSGKYKRDRSDWKMLCTICHSKLDDKSGKMKLIRENQELEKWLRKYYLGKSTKIPYATLKRQRWLERKVD